MQRGVYAQTRALWHKRRVHAKPRTSRGAAAYTQRLVAAWTPPLRTNTIFRSLQSYASDTQRPWRQVAAATDVPNLPFLTDLRFQYAMHMAAGCRRYGRTQSPVPHGLMLPVNNAHGGADAAMLKRVYALARAFRPETFFPVPVPENRPSFNRNRPSARGTVRRRG